MLPRQRKSAGFTLFELVVAIGIFSFALLLVIGAYSRFTTVQRRHIQEQTVQEDMRVALQLLNREVRTGFGTTYDATSAAPPSTPPSMSRLTFRNQNRTCVKYEAVGGQFTRSEAAAGTPPDADCAGARYDQDKVITDPDTTVIDRLNFFVQKATINPADATLLANQGFIVVSMDVRAQHQPQVIELQSAITSRQVRPYAP